MSDFIKNRFKSKKQKWETPDDLFEYLNKEFNFDCDVAGDKHNSKCSIFLDKDALKQDWTGICWLNPPYGSKEYKLKDWVAKAYQQGLTGKCSVVMLIPSKTNTEWWHTYCMNSKEVRFIRGRPKFKGCIYGLPQPLAIVIFDKKKGNTKFTSLNLKDVPPISPNAKESIIPGGTL